MEKKSFLLGTLTGVMTRGQILSHATRSNDTGTGLCHATRIFNENPIPKCALPQGVALG